jgi:hypothetical protein
MNISKYLASIISTLLVSTVAHAAIPLYSLSNVSQGAAGLFGINPILDLDFSLNGTFNVLSLGFADYDLSTPLVQSHTITLYNSLNQDIAHATLPVGFSAPAGPGVTSAISPSGFRYQAIDPVLLVAGNYRLSTTFPTYNASLPQDSFIVTDRVNLSSLAATNIAVNSRVSPSTNPLNAGINSQIIFIPANLLLESASPVPEASEWMMMLAGIGVVGVFAKRQRRRAL